MQKPFKIPSQRKVQARNKVFQTRLESKKVKSTIQSIRWAIVKQIPAGRNGKQNRMHSVPRGKANDYERSFKEHS